VPDQPLPGSFGVAGAGAPPAVFFNLTCPEAAGRVLEWPSNHWAHVAELADALDSGFHFWPFFRSQFITSNSGKTIDLLAEISLEPFRSMSH